MQLVGESRAFVALIETLQRQLVSLPKKFYVEMSIFACSRVVLLTTDGPFAETKEQLRLRFVGRFPEGRKFHRDMQCYSRGGTQNGGNQVSDQ